MTRSKHVKPFAESSAEPAYPLCSWLGLLHFEQQQAGTCRTSLSTLAFAISDARSCVSHRADFSAQVRAIRLLVDRHEEVAPSTVVPALQARLPHRQSTLRLCPTWMQHRRWCWVGLPPGPVCWFTCMFSSC